MSVCVSCVCVSHPIFCLSSILTLRSYRLHRSLLPSSAFGCVKTHLLILFIIFLCFLLFRMRRLIAMNSTGEAPRLVVNELKPSGED